NDVLGAGKCLDQPASDRSRFVLIAAIERGLPAADLGGGQVDLAPQSPEHARCAHPHLGMELVPEAGRKERDLHATVLAPAGTSRQRITLTAAGPCTPMVRSFSMSLVRLGPVMKWTADGGSRPEPE